MEQELSRQKRSSAQTTGEMRAHLGSDGRRTTFSRALTNSSQTVPASCGRLGVHDAYRDALRKGRVHEAPVEPRAAVASCSGITGGVCVELRRSARRGSPAHRKGPSYERPGASACVRAVQRNTRRARCEGATKAVCHRRSSRPLRYRIRRVHLPPLRPCHLPLLSHPLRVACHELGSCCQRTLARAVDQRFGRLASE